MNDNEPIWTPSPDRILSSHMFRFARAAEAISHRSLPDQDSLWQWSVEEPEAFWTLLWSFCGVIGDRGEEFL